MKNVDELGSKEKPCTISGVSESELKTKIQSVLADIEKMDNEGEWYGFMSENGAMITKLWNYCR